MLFEKKRTASDGSAERTADAMRKLHFEEYTFDDRSKEATVTRWGLRVRAYHVYACSEGKMPIMLHGTMEGNAYYDQSGSQKFITSVAAALGRPYRSAPKASSVFFAFRGGRKVYEQDKFAHWNGMCALCSEHLPRWRRSCSSTSPVERFVWHCRE